ncbi:hypothetical protein AGROH133_06530 [Agrobacterium tumefaciens]|nr:hypothetical protein AGROH133_06530 [Agrobacterium tumefaciens]
MNAVLPGRRQTWRKPKDGPGGGNGGTFMVTGPFRKRPCTASCEIRLSGKARSRKHPSTPTPISA